MDYIKVEISGGYVLISPQDADVLMTHKWYVDNYGYASAFYTKSDGSVGSVRLHQLIQNKMNGYVTDHVNRVKLDNRRSNLRYVTQLENLKNRGAAIKDDNTPFLQEELLKRKPVDRTVLTVGRDRLGRFKALTKDNEVTV